MKAFGTILFVVLLTACGVQKKNASSSPTKEQASGKPVLKRSHLQAEFGDSWETLASAKLRNYCQACHAVGKLRFIWNEDDSDLWAYIFENNAPNRGVLWAEAIAEVLDWPSDVPPPPSPIMDPENGRDWMPRGSKRVKFADETVDGMSLRQVILGAIKDRLQREQRGK